MKIKDLMEKLSKMDKNQELIVEGLEDEVETTEEETVDTPEEEISVWDREIPDEAYADEPSKGFHDIIKIARDKKLGQTGKMKTPGADKDSPDAGIYYDENKNNISDLKKLKLIAKWKWIEAGMPANFGGHIDDEIELPKYEEYKAKYDAWKAENPGIAQYVSQDDEELDECGSACGKMTECGKTPIKEGKEETKVEEIISDINNTNQVDGNGFPLNEYDEPIDLDYLKRTYSDTNEEILKQVLKHYEQVASEDAEVIEARLNEQMKTDYQKELESISDFLF